MLLFLVCIIAILAKATQYMTIKLRSKSGLRLEIIREMKLWSNSKDVYVNVELKIEEAMYGKTFPLKFQKTVKNSMCHMIRCRNCGGTGRTVVDNTVVADINFSMSWKTDIPCPYCQGTGWTCDDNNSSIYSMNIEEVALEIPPGVMPGSVFTLHGKGHEIYDFYQNSTYEIARGNIVANIMSVSGSVNGTELVLDKSRQLQLSVPITPEEALTGFERNVTYVQGRKFLINRLGKVTLPNATSTLAGMGYPRHMLPLGTVLPSLSNVLRFQLREKTWEPSVDSSCTRTHMPKEWHYYLQPPVPKTDPPRHCSLEEAALYGEWIRELQCKSLLYKWQSQADWV